MKFMRTRPSGKDQDVPVFEIAFGIQEFKLIVGMAQTMIKNLPVGEDWKATNHRLRNIVRVMMKAYKDYKNEKI